MKDNNTYRRSVKNEVKQSLFISKRYHSRFYTSPLHLLILITLLILDNSSDMHQMIIRSSIIFKLLLTILLCNFHLWYDPSENLLETNSPLALCLTSTLKLLGPIG